MARLTIGQKGERVLKLLYGLRNPKIARVLVNFGFNEDERKHGWSLLAALTDGRLNHVPTAVNDPKTLERLDHWENLWFPIARASTQHRFPNVHEWLFRNISQTDGLGVVISVQTFVGRVEQLGDQGQLDNAQAARTLLEQRGLNRQRLDEARSLLTKLQEVQELVPEPEGLTAAHRQAEDALWAWYLEWGAIARSTIKDRRLLRELGFLQSRTTPRSNPDSELDAGEELEELTQSSGTAAAN